MWFLLAEGSCKSQLMYVYAGVHLVFRGVCFAIIFAPWKSFAGE